jgi:hypothetical protein
VIYVIKEIDVNIDIVNVENVKAIINMNKPNVIEKLIPMIVKK